MPIYPDHSLEHFAILHHNADDINGKYQPSMGEQHHFHPPFFSFHRRRKKRNVFRHLIHDNNFTTQNNYVRAMWNYGNRILRLKECARCARWEFDEKKNYTLCEYYNVMVTWRWAWVRRARMSCLYVMFANSIVCNTVRMEYVLLRQFSEWEMCGFAKRPCVCTSTSTFRYVLYLWLLSYEKWQLFFLCAHSCDGNQQQQQYRRIYRHFPRNALHAIFLISYLSPRLVCAHWVETCVCKVSQKCNGNNDNNM